MIAGLAVMLVVFGLSGSRGDVDDITRRLERYAEIGEPAESRERRPASPRELLDRFTDVLQGMLAGSARTDHLTEDLARADLKLKSSEWVLGVIGAGIGIGLLATLRFGTLIAFLPCPVVVWFISGFVLRFLQAQPQARLRQAARRHHHPAEQRTQGGLLLRPGGVDGEQVGDPAHRRRVQPRHP